MIYAVLVDEKLKEFRRKFPSYSYGEIMFTVFNHLPANSGKTPKQQLIETQDQDFYKALCKAFNKESED